MINDKLERKEDTEANSLQTTENPVLCPVDQVQETTKREMPTDKLKVLSIFMNYAYILKDIKAKVC